MSELLNKFYSEATPHKLKKELIHFAQNWKNLKKSLTDVCYETDLNDSDFPDEDLDLTNQENDKSKSNTKHFRPEVCGSRSSKSYCKNCVLYFWYVVI